MERLTGDDSAEIKDGQVFLWTWVITLFHAKLREHDWEMDQGRHILKVRGWPLHSWIHCCSHCLYRFTQAQTSRHSSRDTERDHEIQPLIEELGEFGEQQSLSSLLWFLFCGMLPMEDCPCSNGWPYDREYTDRTKWTKWVIKKEKQTIWSWKRDWGGG